VSTAGEAGPARARERAPAGPITARHPFFWLATFALVIGVFARGQEVFIPLALAVLVAFAMTPAVIALERRLGRGLAVALVVVAGLAAVGSVGMLLKYQLTDLSTQLTKYSESIRRKVVALRGDENGGLAGLSKALDQMVQNVDKKVVQADRASPVRVVPDQESGLERIEAVVGPAIRPAAKAVVVLVLVIFLLGKREDLRDRVIRLLGRRNISLTTRTLDEAGERISRFLVVQTLINIAFGLVVAGGLLLIGVPYAPLWGFLAGVLRFVPFLGSVLAMTPPALLAFAQLPGWWPAAATVGLFISLDIVVAYAVEPLAIGRRTGVSSMAMVVAAIFWTWLWGPLGLLLSTPLTVCLVVLGRQVPRLEFLSVLLGDEPALEANVAFYQRLLARDEDEAAEILERALGSSTRVRVLDEMVLPALLASERDRSRGAITDADQLELVNTVRVLIANLPAEASPGAAGAALPVVRRILGVPARNAVEELIWEMLTQLLDPQRFVVQSVGAEALVSEVVTSISDPRSTDLVCITSFPPGGLSQLRHLCKRLRGRRADLEILVVRAALADAPEVTRSLVDAGASQVAFTLAEAAARIERQRLIEPAAPPLQATR
jgi:predicted PurR-regulated permease PerM